MLTILRLAYDRLLVEEVASLPNRVKRIFEAACHFVLYCPARHARELATVTTSVVKLYVDDADNKFGDFPLGTLRELNKFVHFFPFWMMKAISV